MRKKLIGGWAAVAEAVMLTLPLSAADASDPTPLDSGAVDEFVEFQIEKHRVPGLALAMIEGGEVTHLASFGEADDSSHTGYPFLCSAPSPSRSPPWRSFSWSRGT